jgi:GDP-4-dehydro-6-deoxy-D-mannose reductase
MQKVLVTGINGFVGQHVAHELIQTGIDVVGIGGPGSTAAHDKVTDYLSLDLTKAEEAARIDFAGIDGVIHLAGLAAVGPSFDKPVGYVSTNVGIQTNLFEAALAQDTRPRFLIISTGALYDASASLPLTEESTILPNSPYAVSKIGQEAMARYYTKRGIESVIARPFNHIGPGQGLGFIVPDLTNQILAAEKVSDAAIKVGNLDARRDYTDVRDIARAYRLLLEKGQSGEIYNVCSGTARSGHEILEGLLKITGTNPKIEQDEARMRPADTPELRGSHDKLTRDTDWQPEISLEQTLQDVVTDWRNRT